MRAKEFITEGIYTNKPNHVYDILKYALRDAEKTGKKVIWSAGGYYKLAPLDDPQPALDHNYDRPNQIAKLKAEIDNLEQIRMLGFSNPTEYKKLYYRKYGPHYKGPQKLQAALKKKIADLPYAVEKEQSVAEDWNKVNKKDKTDGLSQKAVNAYRRENPGSKLKTAVTTKPSKLKAGSKDAKRRKSFCARMSGNKGPMKDEKGRPTPKAKALSRWNCEE
jgi:hypothetical protein